jgi:hypothetical protein
MSMAKLYYNLIAKGIKTIDDVPMAWRDAVLVLLEQE